MVHADRRLLAGHRHDRRSRCLARPDQRRGPGGKRRIGARSRRRRWPGCASSWRDRVSSGCGTVLGDTGRKAASRTGNALVAVAARAGSWIFGDVAGGRWPGNWKLRNASRSRSDWPWRQPTCLPSATFLTPTCTGARPAALRRPARTGIRSCPGTGVGDRRESALACRRLWCSGTGSWSASGRPGIRRRSGAARQSDGRFSPCAAAGRSTRRVRSAKPGRCPHWAGPRCRQSARGREMGGATAWPVR